MIKIIFTVIVPIMLIFSALAAIFLGIIKLISEKDDQYILLILFGLAVFTLTLLHPIIMSIIGLIVAGSFLFENC